MAPMRVDDVAALLRSAAIKKRLEGVTTLAEMLHAHASGELQMSAEDLSALLPDVLPCLRDHNSKVVSSALESLDVILAHVSEQTVQSYFKVLWLNLVEKLGDSKLHVREKAVDVAVQLANVLDVATVFDRLLTVRCIWRCLDEHDLVNRMKDEVLGHIIKLLEDSAKEVRDAAVETLENFYARVGPALLRDLESKNIRSAQMKTLTDRFRGVHRGDSTATMTTTTASSSRVMAFTTSGASSASSSSAGAAFTGTELPSSLSSILSSYDLPVTSSSSSMARYLESIRKRELSTLLAAAAASRDGARSPSQMSTTSSKSDSSMRDDDGDNDVFNAVASMSDRDIQRDVAAVYEHLHLDNDWSKRVDALKALQQLAVRVGSASDSVALASLAHALKSVRERLCEQVADLRSSVSREACATIQTLARVLRDDFNAHAEGCLGALLKATYVTIQVISTAADACIRGVIESTRTGYVRFITRLLEGAKSRNQVLRLHCVSYLTLTLQRWSVSHLSKHSELFLGILPAILHDALAEVRAQSRKCFWAFQRVFPTEGNALFERLDASTQRNLRDDRPSATAEDASASEPAARPGVRKLKSNRSLAYDASVKDVAAAAVVASASMSVQRVLQHSVSDVSSGGSKPTSGVTGPRRVLGVNALSVSDSYVDVNGGDSARGHSRVLSQGALRVGFDAARLKASSISDDGAGERKRQTPVRPLRVLSSSESSVMAAKTAAVDAVFTSRPDPSSATSSTGSAGFHTSVQVAAKPKRIQIAGVDATPPSQSSHADQENELIDRSKRVAPVLSPRTTGTAAALLPSASRTETTAVGTTSSSATSASGSAKVPPAAAAKPASKPVAPVAAASDKLEDALTSLRSSSWSVRLDAIEFLRGVIERRASLGGLISDHDRVDDRVVRAFVKHLSDGHYRVAHAALRGVLPLLHVASAAQVQPQLRALLAMLLQRLVETKESIRAVARATLDALTTRVDASLLLSVAVPMLLDGGNMKVKAALCHYVRELLPRADAFVRSSVQLRALLATIAQLVASDMPVSVANAGRELLQATVRLYAPEVEAALPQLPTSKRTALLKVLKAKGIALHVGATSASAGASGDSKFAASTTSSSRGSGHDAVSDNQASEPVTVTVAAGTAGAGAERSSRKRSESPNANSASPQRTIQKRKSADDSAGNDSSNNSTAPTARLHTLPPPAVVSSGSSAWLTSEPRAPATAASFDDWLSTLAANNATDREHRAALHKVLAFAKAGGADDVWDKCFSRLLFLLLDAGVEKDVTALKVLHGLVESQPQRTHGYAHAILQRLLEGLADKVDVASHITESILSTLVSSSREPEQMLEMLAPWIASAEPPVLQVVLRLVKTALEASERAAVTGHARGCFVREQQWLAKVLAPVATQLAHNSSDVRKSAVNCVVAYYFAVRDDPDAVLWGFLADRVDTTKKKLVQIFVERAKLERRQVTAAPSAS